MNKKKVLGQFNTTNKDYILSGFENILSGKDVVDPFAGDGDLLSWVKNANSKTGYDIDPEKGWIINDSLLNPIDYTGKWVICNPPYLIRNRSKDKTIYDKYGLDDLYKCAVQSIIGCEGGILIVPVNFLSSELSREIREKFFSRYRIIDCKVFEETVFKDTDTTVCAFIFLKTRNESARDMIVTFMPGNRIHTITTSKKMGWICGEEWYNFISVPATGISRYTVDNYEGNELLKVCYSSPINESELKLCDPKVKDNIMLFRAIDTGGKDGRIKMFDIRKMGIDCLVGQKTFAHVRFENPPSIESQVELIRKFNEKLEWYRCQYNSIFLSAYMNSTSEYSRKRMTFEQAYKLIKVFGV